MKLLCLSILLLVLTKCTSGVEVCPQKPTTFTCTVNDDGSRNTRWIGDNLVFNCTNNIIILPHSGVTSLDPVVCGLATGQLQPPDGDNYTSVLTVVPTLEMSGSEFSVQCAFPLVVSIVMNYSASVIGMPSIPTLTLSEFTIVSTGDSKWNFTLEWELLEEDFISGYVITVDPPLPNDQCSTCIVDSTTDSIVFELGVDDPHNFTILAQNCGGVQNGTQSDTLQIHPQLPDSPRSEPTRLLYQNAKLGSKTGNLERIELIWAPVEPTESITDTIDGSITEYQIRTAGVIVSIDPATCDAKCSGIFDVSQSEEVDVYTVSVIAHNSLPGPGNTTIVGTYNATNDYVTVDLMINGSDCYLIIKQLNGAFNLSLDPGTASSIPPDVEVILLNPSTNYTYIFEGTANDGTKVIVHGSFETDCTCNPLISPSDENGVGCGSCDDDNVDPWIVFLVILVVLLTVVVVVQGAALIYVVIQKRKQGAVNLTTPRETLEMKENMSYGPVRVQSQTATQEPVYEEADTLQQPVRTGGNVAYGHIRP